MGIDEKEFVGVNDETGELIAQRQLESLKEQLTMYDKSIETKEAQRDDYIKQCEVDETVWQIRLRDGNWEKLDHQKQFKYELDPVYWEMVHKKQEYEYRNHRSSYEGQLKKFDTDIAQLKEQRESIVEKITMIESE